MQITSIKIRKLEKESKMKAVVSVVFDDVFVVHDIKVIETEDKTFIAMPNKRMSDGTYKDVAHPINTEFRVELEKQILAQYNSEE